MLGECSHWLRWWEQQPIGAGTGETANFWDLDVPVPGVLAVPGNLKDTGRSGAARDDGHIKWIQLMAAASVLASHSYVLPLLKIKVNLQSA